MGSKSLLLWTFFGDAVMPVPRPLTQAIGGEAAGAGVGVDTMCTGVRLAHRCTEAVVTLPSWVLLYMLVCVR